MEREAPGDRALLRGRCGLPPYWHRSQQLEPRGRFRTPAVGDDEVQGVRVAFVDLSGAPIELIEPLSETSPVSGALSCGRPLVHVCFEVSSLVASIGVAKQHGFHLLGTPTPAGAFGGRRIAWVYSKTWGLVELLERPDGSAGNP